MMTVIRSQHSHFIIFTHTEVKRRLFDCLTEAKLSKSVRGSKKKGVASSWSKEYGIEESMRKRMVYSFCPQDSATADQIGSCAL